jgi:hypothetical protein
MADQKDVKMSGDGSEKVTHSIVNSKFPVFVPYAKELFVSEKEFVEYLKTIKPTATFEPPKPKPSEKTTKFESHPFVDGLLTRDERNYDEDSLAEENKTLTANADVTFKSTKSALVDFFFEGPSVDGLDEAWAEDPEATLKLIFNLRSIHLGKADRYLFYWSIGWLYTYHPRTLLENLVWLTRPIIAKKVKKDDKDSKGEKEGESKPDVDSDEDDFELVVPEGEEASISQYDVKNGVAHGYWKDLLNILALVADGAIDEEGEIGRLLNNDAGKKVKPWKRDWDHENAEKRKRAQQADWHDKVIAKFNNDPTYRALHLTIARLFVAQLRKDRELLHSDDKRAIRHLSLAAKWAPSLKEFHDKHTFIASSIAESFYRHEDVCPESVPKSDRTTYLKYARDSYRRMVLSPLRKALAVVERDIAAEKFERIKYERLPSLAMDRYKSLFLKKDYDHFFQYVEQVAGGKKKISGAVLLPSVLVSRCRGLRTLGKHHGDKKLTSMQQAKDYMEEKILDGQWKTLVQRIRDSGSGLGSSIAICDVSGSMSSPMFKDGTVPMDAAVGLSLLLAEVVEPPFGGCFISFSADPVVHKVGGPEDKRSFREKISYILSSDWGMNTNLDKVFADLILPMAIQNKLKPEDMVKQVFVFSDMQFDAATRHGERWTSSFQRLQKRYQEAGYEMPTVVFWNLAGEKYGNKPVECDEPGVSLLSGYSQGQMKMFLDGGEFEEEPEEEEVKVDESKDDEGDEEMVEINVERTKKKTDPLATVRKAISHPAYRMLKVVD